MSLSSKNATELSNIDTVRDGLETASCQSEYHDRRFNRQVHESEDTFKEAEEGKNVESGYRDAMRLQRLEKEERVRWGIEKEKQALDEGQVKTDLDKTPFHAEIDVTAKELSGSKRKRRWDVGEAADKENKDVKGGEELDAILPATGYAVVTPPPGYAPLISPLKPAMPVTEADTGLAPEPPIEIPGIGSLAFFRAEDARYSAKILKEEHDFLSKR
ncbi:hypothetical protein WOLCODRAFT_161727 [Wolfiporia cocos MD-104 SS10]|uniref:Splicing factor 3B subunit 1 domain-containing protein n=1 Tax=Wolfiporia cocos (strain MD-104) TaxID=742152 RepID=A0A2H3JFP2_WOLCO|nr:hypothetical protein WOLCODRAFT_161727 [Wolfiporia cocos MD-104 SS10]